MRALIVPLALALTLGTAGCASLARAEGEPEKPKAEAPADTPKERQLEEKAALRIENLTLRMQNVQLSIELARRDVGDLAAERERLARDAAKEAGLVWDDYDLDLTKRPITWRPKKR